MDTIKITFNNKTHEYKIGTKLYDIAKDCSEVKDIIAARIGNEVYSLDKEVMESATIAFINYTDLIGNKIYKAGLKFLFEIALIECFPTLEISYEHSVPRGMLGVISGDKILSVDEISTIKSKMLEIIEKDEIIEKLNIQPKEAIRYYKSVEEYEKSDNVQNINDRVVTLYKLHNKLNYFYSLMPYKTGVLKKFELVYLGNNKIIFLFPGINGNGEVPEYVHYAKILDSFYAGKSWLLNLHAPYISELNKKIASEDIKEFIKSNELTFSLEIAKVAKLFLENKDIKFIMIAGPSSSGKTTTTSRISSYLTAYGFDPIKVSLDDYFIDRDQSPKDKDGNYDFESLEAIDVTQFNRDLKTLLEGGEITLPKYNFLTGKREMTKRAVKLKENSIFLIEGLHALNENLTPLIEPRYKYKIYLSPFIPLNIDRHNYISTLDLRLLRRMIRDNRTRGYDVSKTIDNWQSVRNGEEKYIFPYIHQADIIINTALTYEVGVLKVFVEPLLYSVGVEQEYYEEARRLLDFLKQFYPIPGEYVNDESILREFIGGKYND